MIEILIFFLIAAPFLIYGDWPQPSTHTTPPPIDYLATLPEENDMSNYTWTEKMSIAREVKDEFGIDWREVLENMTSHFDDFEVDGYRFIRTNCLLDIMVDELGDDDYILGCFDAGFLADILPLPYEAIKALQEAEAFEALGITIRELHKLEEVAESYAGIDGWGHHFATYDGYEHELRTADYHAFRVN